MMPISSGRCALMLFVMASVVACGHRPSDRLPVRPELFEWKQKGQSPSDSNPWRHATPTDHMDKGVWWSIYGDDELSRLQAQALTGNVNVKIAAARVKQARALLAQSQASEQPQLAAGLRGQRTRTSENRPATSGASQVRSSIQNDWIANASVSYEIDLFGRSALEQQSAKASEEQALADQRNAELVLSADLAVAYFGLLTIDAELDVMRQGLVLQERAYEVLLAKQQGGAASSLDVAQQQALIEANRVQTTLLQRQRGLTENALATLVGVPASRFSLTPRAVAAGIPTVPVSLPSAMLERRPDVAAAERAMAAANLQIGLAETAWFPNLNLSASSGFESKTWANLISAPSLIWALGGQVSQTIWDGGRRQARTEQALAVHEQVAANYQQVVLRAVQEVEDGLVNVSSLDVARRQALAAAASAQRVLDIAKARYEGGLTSYLDVVTAQQNTLNSQRLLSQLSGQQLQSSAQLIKAMGGGW